MTTLLNVRDLLDGHGSLQLDPSTAFIYRLYLNGSFSERRRSCGYSFSRLRKSCVNTS